MKIYLIDKDDVTKQLCQLLKLNAECAKLHWSRSITDIPSEVMTSLETIESFVEDKVYVFCNDKNCVGTLSEAEEDEIMSLLRRKPELRETIGTGIISAGKEAKSVSMALSNEAVSKKLMDAIASGKNVVLF